MNGVSRFLSRREKHREKRLSKHSPNKVLSHFFSSPVPPTDGLDGLYCRLPSIVQFYGGEHFPFLLKKLPCTYLTPLLVQTSTAQSSDSTTLQSHPVPPNLYTIFSNEELKLTEQDEQKKVSPYIMAQHYVLLDLEAGSD